MEDYCSNTTKSLWWLTGVRQQKWQKNTQVLNVFRRQSHKNPDGLDAEYERKKLIKDNTTVLV